MIASENALDVSRLEFVAEVPPAETPLPVVDNRNVEDEFVCPYCKRPFNTRRGLITHSVQYCKERPYVDDTGSR